MEKLICKDCKLEKLATEFYVRKETGCYRKECKKCWYVKQKVKEDPEKTKEYKKQHYLKNKETINLKNKQYYKENKDLFRAARRKWEKENPEKVRINRRKVKAKRKNNDLFFKLKENLRSRYSIALTRKRFNKTSGFNQYIGCGLEELKAHLEKQFKDGMTWENYGLKGWHIDHIQPLDSAKTEEELVKLLHYTNLQPLWAEDNYRKKNKWL